MERKKAEEKNCREGGLRQRHSQMVEANRCVDSSREIYAKVLRRKALNYFVNAKLRSESWSVVYTRLEHFQSRLTRRITNEMF
jgi:hypothetical protein